MSELSMGIVGASGFTGSAVLAVANATGRNPVPFSRRDRGAGWRALERRQPAQQPVPLWVMACGIESVIEHGEMLLSYGARRIVALSSTSVLTKSTSTRSYDQALVSDLAAGEMAFSAWAESHGIDWIILRPTLIYGSGRDRNLSEIARIIRRFGFFPLFGQARGRRQPIHVADLGQFCLAALTSGTPNRAYNVAGGEVLDYRDMVRRIFDAVGRRAIMPRVPLPMFRAALAVANTIPRFAHWTPGMAERMNLDMIFDTAEATTAFGVSPRKFDAGYLRDV